ncbi:hypothetical protein DCO48_01640 [Pseudomonas sp. SDI]|uniref:RHS repeat-associated core domain-containing protein n=1 Tax=Pseudomonas sp. SDI TaxID=2170734 RepID=UPI000DE7AEF8|nr:RHS repeat-associated core domain-containing protein [Pseudomonas sp. SDI]PWB35616.1 hypothetical protein DCO48_01640 [Pseudomonas sp. SDI]
MCNIKRNMYDALDRIVVCAMSGAQPTQRFYKNSRLVTEVDGALTQSIVEHGGTILAQQRQRGKARTTALLMVDRQRSTLGSITEGESTAVAYTVYGYHIAGDNLLGFNGERPEPLTHDYLLGIGYRAFNTTLMRFISADSLSPFGRGGINPYAYCVGDPVNYSDTTGHFASIWRGLMKMLFNNRTSFVGSSSSGSSIVSRTLSSRAGATNGRNTISWGSSQYLTISSASSAASQEAELIDQYRALQQAGRRSSSSSATSSSSSSFDHSSVSSSTGSTDLGYYSALEQPFARSAGSSGASKSTSGFTGSLKGVQLQPFERWHLDNAYSNIRLDRHASSLGLDGISIGRSNRDVQRWVNATTRDADQELAAFSNLPLPSLPLRPTVSQEALQIRRG